jgi:hypothetical protein
MVAAGWNLTNAGGPGVMQTEHWMRGRNDGVEFQPPWKGPVAKFRLYFTGSWGGPGLPWSIINFL